jgi:hypothetical protein
LNKSSFLSYSLKSYTVHLSFFTQHLMGFIILFSYIHMLYIYIYIYIWIKFAFFLFTQYNLLSPCSLLLMPSEKHPSVLISHYRYLPHHSRPKLHTWPKTCDILLSMVYISHVFSICSSVVGHLRWLHSLVSVTLDVINLGMQVSLLYVDFFSFRFLHNRGMAES